MSEKTYTEAEISALLGRAARLQGSGGSENDGLTLEEVKSAAVASGIDPRFVDMAASHAADHERTSWGVPAGVGRSLRILERVTEEDWNRMVDVFAMRFGASRDMSSDKDFKTWKRGAIEMAVSSTPDGALLHGETSWDSELEFPFAVSVVGFIAAITIAGVAIVSMEWLIGLAALLLTLVVAGGFSRFWHNKRRQQREASAAFADVLEKCAAIVHAPKDPARFAPGAKKEAASESGEPESGEPESGREQVGEPDPDPRIDLSDDEDDLDNDRSASHRDRTR